MSILDRLSEKDTWEAFYAYKTSLACPKAFSRELRGFIDEEAYLPVCAAIERGDRFPLARRSVISKQGSEKKRVVYTYPAAENTVLKLLTYLLLRRFDGGFTDALYSFRPGRSAKDAIRRLTSLPGVDGFYSYKADIRDYFNSVSIPRLLPLLEGITGDDRRLFSFLRALLTEPCVLQDREPVEAGQKGIMAGTPLSAFFANLYLNELDRHFVTEGVPYARYSDDIILFAPERETVEAHARYLHGFLRERGLEINPEKERLAGPDQGWTFLGFCRRAGKVDIAPATLEKLMRKMRRKTRALSRWSKRGELDGERAAAAFIRVFNRKLLESPADHELSWSRWFFPVISTDESLRRIDRYAQECLRYLVSGRRTKGRFAVRYQDLKRLGYRSLVHDYYAFSAEESAAQTPPGEPGVSP